MTKINLIATKKLTPSEKALFPASAFELIERDFIAIELLDFDWNVETDLLLFTSKNAVLSVLQNKKVVFV